MKKKKFIVLLSSITSFILIVFIICAVYVNDYYKSDKESIETFKTINEVNVNYCDDRIIVSPKSETEDAFIFYPGGKVEYDAYLPLMKAISSNGIKTYLLKMPFNLAVLDINAADGIIKEDSHIKNWYIGGHSLGGSMASTYISKHSEDYKGLVLLGSYSATNLSNYDFKVLSIYGSEDEIMNKEKYQKSLSNYPIDFKEVIIEGGCHSYFGMYGMQKNDGIPSISNVEQINSTAQYIYDFIVNF